MMRAHCFQHVGFEGLGSIEGWLHSRNASITGTRFFEDAVFPRAEDVDLLVVMGGPMSVNDEGDYPWLIEEKRFIRELIERGKGVLGVCLGAQLIASAMGARVYPNAAKEIGWLPVHSTGAGDGEHFFRFPSTCTVFQWHGETFDLPDGAIHLARSDACVNQAFQLGQRVVGLQFHLETTPLTAKAIVEHCRHELVPGERIQSEAEILSAPPERYAAANALMASLLAYLTR